MNTTIEKQSTSDAERRESRFTALWFTLRMIEVRFRFVVVLVALGLVIGYWDTLQNYWDRWTRTAVATASTVSSGTEFYCPMDPGVVRDGLEPNGSIPKCPICGMPLSLRKKGVPMELPPSVVGRVSLTPDRVKLAGIRTSEVGIRPLVQSIRTVGTVAYDESHQSQIVTRVGGYVERLLVDKTFIQVRQGDPLAEIYSPELYSAVQELKVASGIPGSSLRNIARDKIRLLGIHDAEIDSLLRAGDGQHRVIVRSPASGYIIKKMIQQGSTVSPGQMLFEVADLASVWIEADIYERDLGLLREGQNVEATVEAYPNRLFKGRVSLIYPELNAQTRTNRVRFDVANDELRLRAGMYATVKLDTPVQQMEPFHSQLVFSQSMSTDPAAAILRQSVCPVTGAKLGSMGKPVSMQAAGQTVYLCCAACGKAVQGDPEKYVSRIRTVSDSGVLAVPESAVIDTGDNKIVYVEREDGIYEGVEVQLGPKTDGFYAVIAGLQPGDRVAAAGAFLIDAETRLNPAISASYFGASGGPSGAGTTDNSSLDASTTTTTSPEDPPNAASDKPADEAMNSNQAINFATSRLTPNQLAEIAKLSAEDQAIAREQVLCPVTMEALGSMGQPLKVVVNGEGVMVCCAACVKRLEKEADAMLELVLRWREKNRLPVQGVSK